MDDAAKSSPASADKVGKTGSRPAGVGLSVDLDAKNPEE
jgi:hypothetical protein